MVNTQSLYLTCAWYTTGLWQTDRQTDRRTDRQTDRIPIANTRSQQYLPVQLSRVMIIIWLYNWLTCLEILNSNCQQKVLKFHNIKSKTILSRLYFFVLETPRDQDLGLENYITAFWAQLYMCMYMFTSCYRLLSLGCINQVTPRRVRLVLRWVTAGTPRILSLVCNTTVF